MNRSNRNVRFCPESGHCRRVYEHTPYVSYCPVFDVHYNARISGRNAVSAGKIPYALVISVESKKTRDSTTRSSSLAEHIEWTDKHGSLGVVGKFLRGLGEDDWFHMGD